MTECGSEQRAFALDAYDAGPELPRVSVELIIYPDRRDGQLSVSLDLSDRECRALYETTPARGGAGHDYPEDARERVLDALRLEVPGDARG